MYFVSFGELVVDENYMNDQLINMNGGYPSFNVLHNLRRICASGSFYAVGGIGYGNAIAIDSLKDIGINVDFVSSLNKPVAINKIMIHRTEFGDNTTVISKSVKTDYSLLSTNLPKDLEGQNIVLIISNLYEKTQEFIQHVIDKSKTCSIFLDIGNTNFNTYSVEYLEAFLRNVEMVQINGNVEQQLYKKLGITSNEDFFSKFHLGLLCVTYADKGASYTFINENNNIETVYHAPEKVETVVNSTGAGDAFFSASILSYLRLKKSGRHIDAAFITSSFTIANTLSRLVINNIGARGDRKLFEEYLKMLSKIIEMEGFYL